MIAHISLSIVVEWMADIDLWTWLVWLGRFIGILLVPSVLMQRSTRPVTALAWILALLFLPYVGALLWWILGRNHIERHSRRHLRAHNRLKPSYEALQKSSAAKMADRGLTQPLIVVDEGGLFPTTHDNAVAIHKNSESAFDAFVSTIEDATDHVHLQFYIWRQDETGIRFRDLLAKKARQGVEVRLLYDALGAVSIGRHFFDPITEAGGQIAAFLPVHLWERRLRVNFRNHRKLLIVDGQIGFTGGVNIADEYLDWFDMAFGFAGASVLQIQEIFAEDWYFATDEDLVERRYFPPVKMLDPAIMDNAIEGAAARFVASGPDDRIDRIHKIFFTAITSTARRLHIITPYMVPDNAILTALQTAAMRGVDVRIVVPGRSDVALTQHAGRAFWEPLLEAGVRIYEYQRRILHAKVLIADHSHCIVGSANMDIRSFRLNFEANAIIESDAVNEEMEEIFQLALNDSLEVDLEQFRDRPRRARLLEGVSRLFSPLL